MSISIALLGAALASCRDGTPARVEKVTAPAGSEATQQVAAPTSQPAAGGSARAAAPFSGTLKLDASLPADSVKPTDVLFVMAREAVDGQAGRLVATQRHSPVTFPMQFAIGPENVMMQGSPFTGPFIVNARLDRDGDPMTKGADDLYALFLTPVIGGQKDVELVLKKGPPDLPPSGLPNLPTGSAPSSQPSR